MIQSSLRTLLLAALLAFPAVSALAVQPDEMLKDPAMEARAREISAELRCLVCQNQSIDDSDAPLARDLRILVRERLQAGDSNSEVMQFLVDRYGDFVLLRPQFNSRTYALWIAPLLIFLAGLFLARRMFGTTRAETVASPPELTPQEQQKLRAVLEEDTARPRGGA